MNQQSFLIFIRLPDFSLDMLLHQSLNVYTKYFLNASSLVKKWIRFILLPFLVVAFKFYLVQSLPLPSDLLERKQVNTFLSKAQMSLSLPSNCIRNPHADIRCACVVLIFICFRYVQAESQGKLQILGESWNRKEKQTIIIV